MRSDRARALVLAALLVFPSVARAQAQADPMAEYRERFKSGLARYQAGATAEAIQWWEPIYRELGPERGWRLAFNLARAYDALGDTTRTVEHYESFLAQVDARRGKNEPIEELIAREEKDARERLDEIRTTKGRIVLPAGAAPIAVRVDGSEARLAGFTAYVAPGAHTIVFDPGSERESRQQVEVNAGEAITVNAPAPAPAPAPSPAPPTPAPVTLAPRPPAPVPSEPRVERPFPATVLFVAGGATIVSAIVPILTYRAAADYQSANKLSGDSDAASAQENARIQSDYDARKTTYYATLAIPITLGAITGALTAWYFAGARATAGVDVGPGRASLSVVRAF